MRIIRTTIRGMATSQAKYPETNMPKKIMHYGQEIEVLTGNDKSIMTREQLNKRAQPRSQGGTRPDDMSREDWRTSQGAYYDDDRC